MQNIPRSFKEIKSLIKSGELTCEKLVTQYLDNINEQKDLNVFITLFENNLFNFLVFTYKNIINYKILISIFLD